jgi:hypothetical protein
VNEAKYGNSVTLKQEELKRTPTALAAKRRAVDECDAEEGHHDGKKLNGTHRSRSASGNSMMRKMKEPKRTPTIVAAIVVDDEEKEEKGAGD